MKKRCHAAGPSSGATSMNRRAFLWRAGAAAAPLILPSRALGFAAGSAPSERVVMGAIGMGSRGRVVLDAFLGQDDVQVVAVCDVNRARREDARAHVNQRNGGDGCAAYVDLREICARDDIDAVLIATGDNWHAMASILAARAGKDMYCEKPMSVTVAESRAVADTMRRYARIFQCGTQRRSMGNFVKAVDLARSGRLGRLTALHAEQAPAWVNTYETLLPAEPEPPREDFAWDLWLGPALWRPYNAKYHGRGFWSGHLDFSGGSITEWCSHTADLCQWANDADTTGPLSFEPRGDRYVGRYANGVELVIRHDIGESTCGVRFEGEEGWVQTDDSGKLTASSPALIGGASFRAGYHAEAHVRSFLDSVRSRRPAISNADVAHRSISASHVANISRRLNRPVRWDPAAERFIDDEEANRLLTRPYREPWYL